MKALIVLVGSTIAMAMGLPSLDTCRSLEQGLRASWRVETQSDGLERTLRSGLSECDMLVDYRAAEFSACLHRLLPRERKIDREELKIRVMCFHSFMREADSDGDKKLDQRELQIWTGRKLPLRISLGTELDSEMENFQPTDMTRTIDALTLIPQLTSVLQTLSEGDIPGAILQVYEIISGADLTDNIADILSAVLQSLNEENIPDAIGKIYFILSDTTDEAEAGIIGLSTRTVKSVATLLQAVIEGSEAETITVLIVEGVSGVVSDFTFLSYESALAVARVIQTVIENNGFQLTDDVYAALIGIVSSIPDLDDEIKISLEALVESVREGNNADIILGIFQVLSKIFNVDLTIQAGGQFAATITAIIQAVIEGNPSVAIAEIIKLYGLITSGSNGGSGSDGSGGSGSGGSGVTDGGTGSGGSAVAINAETRAVLTQVLESLNVGNIGTAISRLNILLITSSEDSIGDDARRAIMNVITELSSGNLAIATTQLNLLISTSPEEETISSETISALTQAVQHVNNGDNDLAVSVITAILNGEYGGSSLSEETRTTLASVSTLLSTSSQNVVEALTQLNAILLSSGNSGGGVTTNASENLAAALQALESGDSSTARSLLTALLSDSTLTDETKTAVSTVIQLLDQNNIATAMTQTFLLISRISEGTSSISSQTVSILKSLLVSISSGEVMLSVSQLQYLITSSSSSSTMSSELKILLSAALDALRGGDKDTAVSQITVVIDIGTGTRSGRVRTTPTTPTTTVATTSAPAAAEEIFGGFFSWLGK